MRTHWNPPSFPRIYHCYHFQCMLDMMFCNLNSPCTSWDGTYRNGFLCLKDTIPVPNSLGMSYVHLQNKMIFLMIGSSQINMVAIMSEVMIIRSLLESHLLYGWIPLWSYLAIKPPTSLLCGQYVHATYKRGLTPLITQWKMEELKTMWLRLDDGSVNRWEGNIKL
jgi:hypothetical protein